MKKTYLLGSIKLIKQTNARNITASDALILSMKKSLFIHKYTSCYTPLYYVMYVTQQIFTFSCLAQINIKVSQVHTLSRRRV